MNARRRRRGNRAGAERAEEKNLTADVRKKGWGRKYNKGHEGSGFFVGVLALRSCVRGRRTRQAMKTE